MKTDFKMTSQELNNLVDNANDNIKQLSTDINSLKEDIKNKLILTNLETSYTNDILQDILSGGYQIDNNLHLFDMNNKGIFDIFGTTIHPKFIKPPINILNIKTSTVENHFFYRSEVKISINGEYHEDYTSILKHDSFDDNKTIIKEFSSPNISISIENTDNFLGDSLFNVIEIDPYLNGSFDIQEVIITSNDSLEPTITTLTNIKSVGQMRLALKDKMSLHKIVFKIKINYSIFKNDIKVYPFGLKHIYLLNADFYPESYIIANIKKDSIISRIENNIRLKTPEGLQEDVIKHNAAEASDNDIELYLRYENGMLQHKIDPNQKDDYDLAYNTTDFSAKIPLMISMIPKVLLGISFDVKLRK